MNHRSYLPGLITLFASCLLPGNCPAEQEKSPPPNFLFIIADDCTYRDIGCYGGQAHTPNIDALARQGMRFTRSFQAAPMCSPTRHNIYTGIYPVKSGAYPNHTFVKAGTRSIVNYLKPLGYRVALSGKTHIQPRSIFSFEYSADKNNPDMKVIDQFLGECRQDKTPFCLFACSNEPHSPWNKGDASRYDPAKVTLPPYFVDTPETRRNFSNYLAEITYLDGQVGECLRLLEKHQVSDNTLVIFTSEQGSGFPFAKWTCYDNGLQNALIASWPGKIKPGQVSDAMIEYVDVVPTFVSAAGGKPAKVLDGKSYLPVLLGQVKEHKKHVYALHTTRGIINGNDFFGIRSIRGERYKLIMNLTPEVRFQNACTKNEVFRSWEEKAKTDADAADKVRRYRHRPGMELFDLNSDPLEWKNLAADPKLADIKSDLQARLMAWMKSQGDQGQQTELEALQHQGRNRNKNNKKKNNNSKNNQGTN
ncbi:MAG: sulfatase [Planctomycetota bacterium]|nr:sulfatase [Planctomycetota bacterium]